MSGPAVPQWDVETIAALALEIQQVPAPTGDEQARAALAAERLRAAGLEAVEIDGAPNVYARLAGRGDPGKPALMVSAHTDTVFPAATDLSAKREGDRLHGPGIGDNSLGLAGLLTLAEAAVEARPACDVWFVANAAEEGLGDLRGMRLALDRLGERVKACLVLEGVTSDPWPVTHRALGSRRFRVTVHAPGGHSWGAFGAPSAVHLLVGLAEPITRWDVPSEPKTTYNIGVIEGGTSVNTIAERASLLLDLRSEDPDALAALVARAETLFANARLPDGATLAVETVGDRPAGEIAADHPLTTAAVDALVAAGAKRANVRLTVSSTDANIPLSRGIPAVTLYLAEGHDVHRTSEWLSLARLPTGLGAAWRLLHAASALDPAPLDPAVGRRATP